MNNRMALILICGLALSGCADVQLKPDELYTVSLPSNPTTGYSWEVKIESELISLVSQEYQGHGAEMVGAGGVEIFTLLAQESGQIQITFSYLRSWEDGPIKQKTYNLTITE